MNAPFTSANDLIELRSPWANIEHNVRLTHAKIQASQQLIRQSLYLMQAAAKRVRPPAGDSARQAAALGPSLARLYMRRHVLSAPPMQPEDSEITVSAVSAKTTDGSA
jgi:hypothetical protein